MASEAKVSGEVSRVDKFLDRAKKGEILPPHAIKWVCAAATKVICIRLCIETQYGVHTRISVIHKAQGPHVFREEPNLVCHQAPVK
eukprot:1391635-Amorphochlora_amoeboformis.AAC.2